MAIQIRGVATVGASSTSPRTINKQAATQAGDTVLLHVNLTADIAPTSTPDGFTLVSDGTTNAQITGTNCVRIYRRIATSSEPASYSVDFASGDCALGLLVLHSDAAKEIAIGAVAVRTNATSTNRTWNGVNFSAPGFMAMFSNHGSGIQQTTPPGGTDEQYDTGGASRLYLMTESIGSAGATGTRVGTNATSTTSKCVTIGLVEVEAAPDPPAAPSGLTATAASPTQINLSWTDNSNNETGFEIDQSPDNSSWSLIHTTAANATSYNVTGLDEYALYYFRVRAVNGDGESAYATAASARTHIYAPTSLAATAIDHQSIALTWEDNSGVEDGYKVEQSPDGSDWTQIHTTAADAISYNVTGLSPNTEYYFRVRAFASGDNSAYSNTDNALTDLAPLVTPTDLVATPILSTEIRLTWADSNADEDEFEIERSPDGSDWAALDTTTATSYADEGLTPETEYHYRVRAVRGLDESDWSDPDSATTYAALTEPTSFVATVAGPRQINLSWSNTDTPRSGFRIERSPDGETGWTQIGDTPSTSFQVTGLEPESTHFFRVRAYREGSIEFSPYSEIEEATTDALPAPPKMWRLYLLSPTIIFAASVNEPGGVTYPLDEVRFDNVTAGSFSAIQPGMLAVFRLPASPHPVTGHDLGRQRVRKAATSNTLYIGRSSQGKRDGEVDIVDNVSITVLDLYGVHSKIPRFDPDGTTYKDSDLAYTDQTIEPPPVANTGPAMAGTIDADTDVLTVDFDAGASFATADGASITSYLWDVGDGTITVGADTDQQITVEFPAGFRWVALTVEDSNGKTHTARCPVFARDPEDDECIQIFEIETHRITPQGQQVGVRVRQPIDIGDYPDGTLALLWYGEPATPDDRSHMQFTGWIQQEPVNQAAQRTGLLQEVTLNCVDVAGRLDLLPGLPQVVRSDATRDVTEYPSTTWYHMVDPNMDKYLHYLLQWHSTALEVADWTWTGTGANYPFIELMSDGQSLYDQVQRRASALVPDYHLTCNRRGQLQTVVDPMVQDESDRTEVEQATISLDDWSAVRYDRTRPPRVHWLRSNAILARTDIVAPIFCQAPGETPGQGEQELDHGEQLARNQTDLNAVTGHRYARINAPQSKFTVTLADGDDRGIEPADMTWVRLLVGAAQRVPGQVFDRRGLVQEINIRYDHQRTGLVRTVELQWERETVGTPAITVIPAGAEPVPDGDFWGPPPVVPVTMAFDFLWDGQQNVALLDNACNLFRTSNFQDSSPTWDVVYREALGFPFTPSSGTSNVMSWCVDPFSSLYRGLGSTVNGWVVVRGPTSGGGGGVYRLTDIFGTPSVTLVKEIPFMTGSQRAVLRASFGRYQEDEADNPWLVCLVHWDNFPGAGGDDGHYVTYSTDGGQSWSTLTQINNNASTNATGLSFNNARLSGMSLYLSPRTPGLAYTIFYSEQATVPAAAAYVSEDWGATWSALSEPAITPGYNLGGTIHVPWDDNPDEQIAYYGAGSYVSGSNPATWRLRRANGAVDTDISPVEDSANYGPVGGEFCIRTYSGDRQYMVMCGAAEDSWSGGFPGEYGVFVSDDAGDTWALVHGPELADDVWGRVGLEAAFAGDNPDVLFIWGGTATQTLVIGYSDDFGATVQDKLGNLGTIFGADGIPEAVVGVAGGDGPP